MARFSNHVEVSRSYFVTKKRKRCSSPSIDAPCSYDRLLTAFREIPSCKEGILYAERQYYRGLMSKGSSIMKDPFPISEEVQDDAADKEQWVPGLYVSRAEGNAFQSFHSMLYLESELVSLQDARRDRGPA